MTRHRATVSRSSVLRILVALVMVLIALPFSAMSPANAAPVVVIDEQGANDEPGQKDLTRMSSDSAGLPTTLQITWNWDEIDWSGANTGDACALFDTDGDGNVNFSLCAVVDGSPAQIIDTRLYSCGDDRVDRCSQPITEIEDFDSSCAVAQTDTDPFLAGDEYPTDTTATCTIVLDDVGADTAVLLNVCSYPSQEPNSDPSDCVRTPRDGFIKVVKIADPDDDTVFEFTLDGEDFGETVGSGEFTGGVVSGEPHELAEVVPAGWTLDSATCDNGDDPAAVTVEEDETVTCTFENSKPAHLTLVKDVVNDNGGTAAATAWTLSAAGPTPISGSTGSAAVTDATVSAGTYDLSESGPGGYGASEWDCVGGDQTDGDTVTIANGDDVTCTITNDDIAPTLTLVKVVDNDNGGTAEPMEWTLTATGEGGFSGQMPDETTGVSGEVDAGVAYALSEDGPDGYTASAWDCDGGMQDGASVTLDLDDDVTCTITNTDNPAKLTLVKEVVNDDGGDATPMEWTLTAFGDGGFAGTMPDETTGVSGNVIAGVDYALSESGPPGYEASEWDCDGGTQDGASITLDLGDDVTCTITNDDIAPMLTLVKVVENDDGGDATPMEWTLTATGEGGFSGQMPDETTGVSGEVDAGVAYALSEDGPDGYTASAWDCDGGMQDGASVTLDLDDDVTCTITNADNPAHLTLVKEVVNDNGGTAEATDWTLSAVGPTPLSGAGGAEGDVDAGAYDLSESDGPAGYTASEWECDGGSLDGSELTLELGDDVTCTITNDDKPQSITVKKRDASDGELIDTATFQLWLETNGEEGLQTDGDEQVDGEQSTIGGIYTWDDLDWGTYYIEETGAPTGYELPAETVQVVVLDGDTAGTAVKVTFEDPRKLTDLVVEKRDAETHDLLAGATFQLWSDIDGDGELGAGDEELGDEKVSGADGQATWDGLDFGDYLVEETDAPEGYELPDDAVQAFSIGAETAGETVTLVFHDQPIHVTPPPTPTPTPTPTPPPAPPLPDAGAPMGMLGLLGLGAAALVLGSGILLRLRRRGNDLG